MIDNYKRLYVSVLLLIGGALTIMAQSSGDDYNPDNPDEPGDISTLVKYPVSVVCSLENAGTVSGSGEYLYGTSVKISTTPKSGYKFQYWTKNDSQESYSTNTSFTYTVASENVTFTAVYEKYKVVSVTTSNAKAGTVSGGGSYLTGNTATLTATEASYYKFLYWTKNDESVPYSTDKTISYVVENEDVTFKAVYEEPKQFTVGINDTQAGTVSASYCYNVTGYDGTTPIYGTETYAKFTTTPNTGYVFQYWLRNNENVAYTTETTFEYKMDADVKFTAVYKMNPDNPSEPGDASTLVSYNVAVGINDAEAGVVSGGGKYKYGKSITLSTSANAGYEFCKWQKDGEDYSTATSFSYTVTDDVSFTAVYEYVGIPDPEPTTHKLYLTADPAGSCTFNMASGTDVDIDGTYSVTATPGTDWKFLGWYQNGELVSSDVTYSTYMGTEDVTLTARCTYDPDDPDEPTGSLDEGKLVGDIDNSGTVNVSDAVDLITHYLNNTTSELEEKIADVDGNGVINVSDAIEIIQIYLNNK